MHRAPAPCIFLAQPPRGLLGLVVSIPSAAVKYLETIEESFGPKEEVSRANEAEFPDQGHRDGGGEPVTRNGRDAPEPVPNVRHLRLVSTHWRRAAGSEGGDPAGGRGATEFGPARERSAATLPLPADVRDVHRKSRLFEGEAALRLDRGSVEGRGQALGH